jgi:hypothetical protein
MSRKKTIRNVIEMSDRIINSYLSGLSDKDLFVRAVPGVNHIAWQLGHIISSERHFIERLNPGASPPLPEGFDAKHGRDKTGEDDPAAFYPLETYQALWKAQREATLATLESFPETDLDDANPEKYPPYAPTPAAILTMTGLHPIMHAGQFVPVRRLLKLPITI